MAAEELARDEILLEFQTAMLAKNMEISRLRDERDALQADLARALERNKELSERMEWWRDRWEHEQAELGARAGGARGD
jgi:hypothetical protein